MVIAVVSRQMAVREKMQSIMPIPQRNSYFTYQRNLTTTTKMLKVSRSSHFLSNIFFAVKKFNYNFFGNLIIFSKFVTLEMIMSRLFGLSIGATIERVLFRPNSPILSFVYTHTEKSSPIFTGNLQYFSVNFGCSGELLLFCLNPI